MRWVDFPTAIFERTKSLHAVLPKKIKYLLKQKKDTKMIVKNIKSKKKIKLTSSTTPIYRYL